MGLKEYRGKRRFNITSEPGGKKRKSKGRLFVVQQHAASHLHYDFRLELDGVLKSWAVPKGPSLNPQTKRLSMMVEDHPLDYADFEGVIPEGEYGAGTVIVWDRGSWLPLSEPHRALAEGALKFELLGSKLKGRWALIRMKTGLQKTSWLLIKEKDKEAWPESKREIVDLKPRSVISGEKISIKHSKKRESK